MADQRPDPDAILASLNREEQRAKRGKLKVFFGMCPGVGKTFAMLRAAQQELRDGVNLVIGVVETHGRAETEALLVGLPLLPRKEIDYKNIKVTEMDLEAILARKPRLVLVDEFAHTNAQGSRHPKRYQDVVEILDAGIDVYTTLNVQHIESRSDAVRQITGAPVHETVPDSIFGLADQIELVDITPEALRERLSEGKVYLEGRAAAAAENFFKDTHLTALRELALRFVAEHVDKRLRELRSVGTLKTVWRSGERLLVAVGPSPSSTQLVRWTRRMAASQGASWTAVSVETPTPLGLEAQKRLEGNLALARELGAEIVVTHDSGVAEALVRVALQNNATQIVVGKSRRHRLLDLVRGGTLVDRLLKIPSSIDIYVVPAERAAEKPATWVDWRPVKASPAKEYGEVFGVLAALTVASSFIVPHSGYLSVGLFFLLAIIVLSLRVGPGPVFVGGVASALTWNFFFIPPVFTFAITRFEDWLMFSTYFVVAIISGQLTARVRAQERNERMREDRATALFHLTQALSSARTLDDAVFAALRQADTYFGAKSALLLGDGNGSALMPHFAGSFTMTDKDRGVADWAWRNRKKAGRFTDTLPSAEGFHLPLVREDQAIGVLIIRMPADASLSLAQRDLAESFADQLAQLVEREQLRAAGEREKLLAQSEKLHRSLLDGVSHELKTPLAVLSSAVENLPAADEATRADLGHEIKTATRRLNRLVNNLLDQTRLESGALKPRLDWCDGHDLVNAALEGVSEALNGHPLESSIPKDLPLFRADAALMEQVIANLLLNAALHTPQGTEIFITAGLDRAKSRVYFTVADRGPGLPGAMKERLFQKFQRGDAAKAGGLGLGLSIIRGFVTAQGGDVVAGENPGGGAVLTVYLPFVAHGEVPGD
ncbi:MAG TPA: sensor histidine kinase KdpD [Opitutaceae bacterium]|jgi:two-component system sensor histidine kinase KdpD|nr:sensor histidine kinase KdpD [Opitutaceae bacterium]